MAVKFQKVNNHQNQQLNNHEHSKVARKIRDGEYVGLPVWAYVHGGSQIAASETNPHSCPWDSGQSGWAYVKPSHLKLFYGDDKAAALADLKGRAEVMLGEFESRVARVLRKRCESAGLRVVSSPNPTTSDSLINEQSKMFLLIEDSSLSQAVAQEALRQGLPLRHSTA